MSTPNYILKTEESIKVITNPQVNKIKKAVAIVCVILFATSYLLGDNLLSEMSLVPRVLLVSVIVGCLFGGKKEFRKFPLEIYFYSDMIEIHRKEVHYSNGRIKQELHRFLLADNPKVTYDYRNKFVTIKGLAHGEWYLYDNDGNICSRPERVSDTQGICYFYILDEDIDIVEEIESHSPIKVNRVNV